MTVSSMPDRELVSTRMSGVEDQVRREVRDAALVDCPAEFRVAMLRRAAAQTSLRLEASFDPDSIPIGEQLLASEQARYARDRRRRQLPEAKAAYDEADREYSAAPSGLTRKGYLGASALILVIGLFATVSAGSLLLSSLTSLVRNQLQGLFEIDDDISGIVIIVSAMLAYSAAFVVSLGLGIAVIATKGRLPRWLKFAAIASELCFSLGVAWTANPNDISKGLSLALVEIAILTFSNLVAFGLGYYLAPLADQADQKTVLADKSQCTHRRLQRLQSGIEALGLQHLRLQQLVRNREEADEFGKRVLELAEAEANAALNSEMANEVGKAAKVPELTSALQAADQYLNAPDRNHNHRNHRATK